jgi:hypothetical protein
VPDVTTILIHPNGLFSGMMPNSIGHPSSPNRSWRRQIVCRPISTIRNTSCFHNWRQDTGNAVKEVQAIAQKFPALVSSSSGIVHRDEGRDVGPRSRSEAISATT